MQYYLDNKIMDNEIQDSCHEPGEKRPLGRPVSKWEGNTKAYLKTLVRKGVYGIYLAQGRSTSNDLLHLLQYKHDNLKVIRQFYRLFCVITWRNMFGKNFVLEK
jgi:hypothetical protein